MTELLFVVGIGLALIGKINLGGLNAEGPIVRAAGFMLMMPLIVVLVLSFALGLITGGDTEAMSGTLPFILFLQLPVMIVCVGIAYSLLRRESRSDTTITAEPEQQQPTNTAQPDKPAEIQPPKPQPMRPQPAPRSTSRNNFPNVMGIKDAARYLNTSEQSVMQLIEDGQITAARINYRYQISRRVLDEFIEDQGRSTADH